MLSSLFNSLDLGAFYSNRQKVATKKIFKSFQDINIKLEWPETITRPILRFSQRENVIGSVVIEILSFRQQILNTVYRTSG